MGLAILHDAARTAGVATVLFCLGCMATGLFGILMLSQRTQPERATTAFRLSRNMAELLLFGLVAVWAVLSAAVLVRDARRQSR
jgi:hypothetical protein